MTMTTVTTSRVRLSSLAIAATCFLGLAGCNFFGGAEAHLNRAQSELAAGNSRVAEIEAKKALESNPRLSSAWLVLARASFLQNDPSGATNAIEKAQEAGADSTVLAPLKWKQMYLKGDYAKLRMEISEAPAGVSDVVRYRYDGLALLGLRHPNQALGRFKQVLSLNASDAQSVIGEALAYRLLGKPQRAITVLTTAIAAHPKDARYRLTLADTFMAIGEVAQAEASFAKAASLTSPETDAPTWIMAEAGRAQSAIVQAKWVDAGHALAALNEGAHGLLLTRLLKARVALGEGNLSSATANAEMVVAALPKDVQAHMLLAYSTYRQGYLQQAETSLDEVLSAHPSYAPARRFLAQIQLHEGRVDSAENTLRPLLANKPDAMTLVLAGRIAQAESNEKLATSEYEQALASSSVTNRLRYTIAVNFLKMGDHTRAMQLLKELPSGSTLAKKRDLLLALSAGVNGNRAAETQALSKVASQYASDLTLQRTVARLYMSNGNLQAARTQLNSILKTHPRDIDSMVSLASIEALSKQYTAADQLLNRALAVNPKNETVLMELARIAMEQGDQSGAIQELQTARQANAHALAPRIALARLYLAKNAKQVTDPQALKAARGPVREALAIAPKQMSVVLLAAEYDFQNGHVDQAEALLNNGVTSDPSTAPLLLSLAK